MRREELLHGGTGSSLPGTFPLLQLPQHGLEWAEAPKEGFKQVKRKCWRISAATSSFLLAWGVT